MHDGLCVIVAMLQSGHEQVVIALHVVHKLLGGVVFGSQSHPCPCFIVFWGQTSTVDALEEYLSEELGTNEAERTPVVGSGEERFHRIGLHITAIDSLVEQPQHLLLA